MEKMACVAHSDGTGVKCEHNFSAHGGLSLYGFGHTASACAYTILILLLLPILCIYVYMTLTFLLCCLQDSRHLNSNTYISMAVLPALATLDTSHLLAARGTGG